MAALRLQEEEMLVEKVQGFPVLHGLKVLKKKCCSKCLGESGQNFRFCRNWYLILLEQVAIESILRIVVVKKLVSCSVSEIRTQY